jgi:hypothetical protein
VQKIAQSVAQPIFFVKIYAETYPWNKVAQICGYLCMKFSSKYAKCLLLGDCAKIRPIWSPWKKGQRWLGIDEAIRDEQSRERAVSSVTRLHLNLEKGQTPVTKLGEICLLVESFLSNLRSSPIWGGEATSSQKTSSIHFDTRLSWATFWATFRIKLITWMTWGRCYDHNFRRFLPIFGEKIGVFLKNQCYDHYFCQKIFAKFFGENI